MKLTPEFRDRLNQLIKQRKLTKEQCIKIFNISPKALYFARFEGRYPTPRIISKMAEYFNVSTDYLLGLTDEK